MGLSVLECLYLSVNHSQKHPGSSTSFRWFCPGTDVPLDWHKLHLCNSSEDGRSKLEDCTTYPQLSRALRGLLEHRELLCHLEGQGLQGGGSAFTLTGTLLFLCLQKRLKEASASASPLPPQQ